MKTEIENKNKYRQLPTINYQLSTSSGFTLVELLIAMAMVAILSASTIQVARFSDTHKSLTLASDELRVTLREAQSAALSIPTPDSRHVCGFGVRVVNADSYELYYTWVTDDDFRDDPETCSNNISYRNGNNTNRVALRAVSLPNELSLVDAAGDSLFFGAPYGVVYDENGNRVVSGSSETFAIEKGATNKSITITSEGRIE